MKLDALMRGVAWPDVRAALIAWYAGSEGSIEQYRRVFELMASVPAEPSTMRIAIDIRTGQLGPGGVPLFDISGRNGTLYRQLTDTGVDWSTSPRADQEVGHGLAFTPWEEWLGMSVDSQASIDFTPAQIVAHCLWEMTFYGFEEQEVNRLKSSVVMAIADLEAMTPDERKTLAGLKNYL